MNNKFAMITRCDSKAKELSEVTHPILKSCADLWGCDFIVLGDEIPDTGDYERNHYRILATKDYFGKYERILIIDSDVVITPGTPNPFDIVPDTHIGTIYEDVGSRRHHRREVIESIQDKFGDIGWKSGYINTGFFICSRAHRGVFNDINGQLWYGFGFDDALIGYNIVKNRYPVYELDYKWNHTQMFSEAWNNNADRFDSYIIHYAGAAKFPDDRSGREDFSNALSGRIELIKNDIDRIEEGLATIIDIKPTPKQGYGSRVFTCLQGMRPQPATVKIPNTEICFDREVDNLGKGIPNAVRLHYSCQNPQVGNFMILERLEPLPDKISASFMVEIATKVLETIRWCYKNDVTWIPKLDHIMTRKGEGDVREVVLCDFGDDAYKKIPFFGDDYLDTEGVLMYGKCDSEGNYAMRHVYPLSGYNAIMCYLINKNHINPPEVRLKDIESNMIINEYRSLKDVHQPINLPGFNEEHRTETEPGDPNYGKLVPPNRNCKDRAEILKGHLPRDREQTNRLTWLDIGCNVGWFPLEFAADYRTYGLDKDKDKIDFAQMISDYRGEGAKFWCEDLDRDGMRYLRMYDIISAFSILHLQLIKDKNSEEFWTKLEAICSRVRKMFFLEFPPHSYSLAGAENTDHFMDMVKEAGGFKKVEWIGTSDAGRPMLKCVK